MCVTAAIMATSAVVGTVASIGASKANAAQQKLALQMQRKELADQREAARLQAMAAEADRVREYNAQRASNLAALAASGTRSESFLQGIEPASEAALAFDLRNIRMAATGQDIASMRGIRVNKMTSQAVGIASGMAQLGAVASGLGGLAQAGKMYQETKG